LHSIFSCLKSVFAAALRACQNTKVYGEGNKIT